MELYWLKTRFTWIASKTSFEHTDRRGVEYGLTPQADIVLLSIHLLELGGDQVCIRFPDPDFPRIVRKGKLFSVSGLHLETMEEHECHSNSSVLWMRNKRKYNICTGYALTSEDQMWRQHTWLLDRRMQNLVETTLVREKYYGIEIQGLKAYFFAKMNA